jgi:hypothetical protein
MAKTKKQPETEKISKKQLSKVVFEKLTGSLSEFNLKEKKLGNRLEKVSRQLASDIVKVIKKETPANDKNDEVEPGTTRRKKAAKKAAKKEKLVVTE